MVSVSALVAARQWRIVGVADEPDRYALLIPHVVERLLDLFGEVFGNGNVLVLVQQWRDEVPDAHARRLTFSESHFADFFHAADRDALDIGIRLIPICSPFAKCLVGGQVPLDLLAWFDVVDLTRTRGSGHHEKSDKQR